MTSARFSNSASASAGRFFQRANVRSESRPLTRTCGMWRRQFEDRHRPDFGLGDDRQIRLPVFEEAVDRRLEIERHVLVNDRRTQAPGRDPCRGRRAGRQDDVDAAAMDFLDQRDDRIRLADACGMEPDERTLRPRHAGITIALAATGRVLLALRGAQGKIGPHERVDRRTDPAIARKRQPGAKAAHGFSPPPDARRGRRSDAASARIRATHALGIGINRFPDRAGDAYER